ESIDSAFARLNSIFTSLKALDEGYSSKNYAKKFLRALHPKWRAKVTAIEESKDLTSLSLYELIGNLKIHEMIIKKDSEIVKAKFERKSLALKAKKESSDGECSTSGSEDEEYAMAEETSRSSLKEEVDSCGDPNHHIEECPKQPKDENQRAFVGCSWSDSSKEDDKKVKNKPCLVDQASSEFAKIMHDEFEMSMMGELNFFLGLQIKQMEDDIFFNQSKYIKKMLKKFGLEDSKPMKTLMSFDTKLAKDKECESVDSTKYRGMVGSLLYLTASRPDIMFSVCLCARFKEAPKTSQLKAVKCIFRYIKGTMHLGLWYPKVTSIETVVYVDSDHAGDYVNRKRTSGIFTFVGCCLTSWFSKKQTALAISTTKAKYVSAGKACQQALWMKQALIDYDVRLDDVPIMCDNKGAIDLSKNPIQHSRTKHIEIRHHFLLDNVQKGHISIEKVHSVENIADILTKPLKRESFNYLRLGLGMIEQIP
nr:copia protein [Tanacetum cinerariifolium]